MPADNIIYSVPGEEYISNIAAQSYGIDPVKTVLYRNSGGMLYFIETADRKYAFKVYSIYQTRDKIHSQAYRAKESFGVINHLYENGFAVPKIYTTVDSKLWCEFPMAQGSGTGALFEYIEGHAVDYSDIADDIAETTASMHNIMNDYAGPLSRLGEDFYIGRMMKILRKYYKENDKIRELEQFGHMAFDKIRDLPRGFCHGDFGTHNIASKDGRLFVFDFDVASRAYPMFDIALICDTSNFWEFDVKAIRKTQDNIYRFADIYTKHCTLKEEEIDSFKYFLALRQYEVRATVSHVSLPKVGSHFLNEGYLDSLHGWMTKFTDYVCGP
jgi:Ser/Thr protein kinase RdoA (MazF antagonist)